MWLWVALHKHLGSPALRPARGGTPRKDSCLLPAAKEKREKKPIMAEEKIKALISFSFKGPREGQKVGREQEGLLAYFAVKKRRRGI